MRGRDGAQVFHVPGEANEELVLRAAGQSRLPVALLGLLGTKSLEAEVVLRTLGLGLDHSLRHATRPRAVGWHSCVFQEVLLSRCPKTGLQQGESSLFEEPIYKSTKRSI